MIKFLSPEAWRAIVSEDRQLFFNERLEFVNAVASSFSLTTNHIVYVVRNKVVISLLAYSRGKRIIEPLYFIYSTLWVAKLKDTQYCTYLTDFLNELKKSFNHISFNLNTEILDVRPFNWSGFLVKNRYTYLKNVSQSEFKYTTDINRSIKEFQSLDVKFEIIPMSNDILQQNMVFLRDQGFFLKRETEKVVSFFCSLEECDLVQLFGCRINEELLASSIVLLDSVSKKAYIAFVCKTTRKVSGNHSVHAYLYDEMFKQLSKLGYNNVDLLGANVFSISKFKSKLSANLSVCYQVEYSSTKSSVEALLSKLKRVVKRFLV